jgi:hypothetical protein
LWNRPSGESSNRELSNMPSNIPHGHPGNYKLSAGRGPIMTRVYIEASATPSMCQRFSSRRG